MGRSVAMQAFDHDQGLQSLAVNVLLHDDNGVLWAGTNNGLFRFDGRRFVAVPVHAGRLEPHINDLYLSPSGRLWIGGAQHLYVWKNGLLQRVADISVDDLRRISGDGADGVYVRHQRQLVHVSATGVMESVNWARALSVGALTDGPVLWVGGHLWTTCGPQLCMRTATGTRVWGARSGVPADQWNTLHATKDGDVWVGGDRHLLHLKAGARQFQAISSIDPIHAMDLDRRGRVLAAIEGHISRWDGKHWATFVDDHGLSAGLIRDLSFDPSGTVWLANGGRGLLRWRGYGQFQNWRAEQGLDSAPTWAFARDADGRLWLGNQQSGNVLEPGAQHLTPWPKAMRRRNWTNTTALLAHGRQMWVIFNDGTVVRYNLDTQHAQPVPSDARWTKFGLFDAQGRLWFGTHGVLWRIDHVNAEKPTAHRVDTGLAPDTNYLAATRDDRGNLWFATSRGLLRFKRGQFVRMKLTANVPAGGFVGIACGNDGRLWLAPVVGGLLWGQPGSSAAMGVHEVDDPLLRYTSLYSLAADRAGRVWAGSGAGVDVLTGKHWRRLDRNDGLVWDDPSAGAFFQDTDGSVWLGTSNGVSHVLHPEHLGDVDVSAPVILQSSYGSALLQPDTTTMKWTGKTFAVALASTGAMHPGSAYFQYRLLGGSKDAHWEMSTSHALRYAALPPGQYRFQVRLVNPNLRAHSKLTQLKITLTPPWWRSHWMMAGYALVAFLLLLFVWRLRSAQLLRRQVQLQTLVDERTRELQADKRALEATRRALEYEASHDALTGLLTRGAGVRILRDALRVAPAERRPFAVALIDLDHFKQVNDNYGHLTGDAVLVQCAKLLRRMTPEAVSHARFGGEELLLLWPGLARTDDIAARFAPLNRAEYVDGATRLRVSCSIGVTWLRAGDDVEAVLRRADAAMYRAKTQGRARVELGE